MRTLDYREIITLGPLGGADHSVRSLSQAVLDMSAAAVAQLIDNIHQALGAAGRPPRC